MFKQSRSAIDKVRLTAKNSENAERWVEKVEHFNTLLLKVIDQTQRRVYDEEDLPASYGSESVGIDKGGRARLYLVRSAEVFERVVVAAIRGVVLALYGALRTPYTAVRDQQAVNEFCID